VYRPFKSSKNYLKTISIQDGFYAVLERLIWRLSSTRMLFNTINRPIDFNLTELKEFNITQVVYGILRNRFNFVIWLISPYKRHCMLLRLGLLLEIVSLCRNNISRLWSFLHGLFSSVLTTRTLCHFVDMSMYTTRIFPKQKKCFKAL